MSWQKWVILAWIAIGALCVIFAIGKQRKPVTSGAAVFVLLLDAGIAALVVTS